jgi:hypothetical protein
MGAAEYTKKDIQTYLERAMDCITLELNSK